MGNKISLADLGKHRDRFVPSSAADTPPSQKKAAKPKPGTKSAPLERVPLQVLKFDDLAGVGNQKNSPYETVFFWQVILVDLLDIVGRQDRLDEVQAQLSQTQDKELKTILERLKDNPKKPWGNTQHRLAIQSEIAKLDDRKNAQHRLAIQSEIAKLDDHRIRIVLEQTASADGDRWQGLYADLADRTELLASSIRDDATGQMVKAIVTAEFPWRTRVGGLPGFRERLLPVMHPVYGVPYIPASSIKGLVRAWAKQHITDKKLIVRLLGYLKGSEAAMSAVGFLDAFPTGPSLSCDVATPQWKWLPNHQIAYGPAPHQLLTLEALELKIGLTHTSRNAQPQDIHTILEWLTKALLESGLGSRISSGYGVAAQVNPPYNTEAIQPSQSWGRRYPFEFWSQGMYGSNPPAKHNEYTGTLEFRPSAIRGVLRYWFRAIALGFYSPADCKALEQQLFGAIEPKALAGSMTISVQLEEENFDPVHQVKGIIIFKSDNEKHLNLMEKVLQLASHLSGVGRGNRRPLHWNQGIGLRGCHWQLQEKKVLPPKATDWQTLFRDLRKAFELVQAFTLPGSGHPGTSKQRYQDAINQHCRIYLVPDVNLKRPEQVQNWDAEGVQDSVRGKALKLLYEGGFKGKSNQGTYNENVGGKLQVPSYALIQSNYPQGETPYQAVTIFGANDQDRQAFAAALKAKGGIMVWPPAKHT